MCQNCPGLPKGSNPIRCWAILKFLALPIFFLSILFNFSSPIAETQFSAIPLEYGRVVYQYNERSTNQLFIIGMSHRNTLTRLNGDNTPKVQAEVYKIGEWLIHQRGLDLLLPEGFFQKNPPKIEKLHPGIEQKKDCPAWDIKALEQMLSDNEAFINAEMLLKKHHLLRVHQVEEERFYTEVNRNIHKLINSGSNACDYLVVKSELDYLQERRIAAMLQKIPEIVDDQFRIGNIQSKKAIFTIGMSHLNKIIQYLDEDRIRIYSPLLTSFKSKDYIADLNLKRKNFAVFILLPRTLLDDPKILEMNKLDKDKFLL